jgi:hypothetical protein
LDDRGCAAEDGRVLLPAEPAWLGDYLHEMTVFPKSKHDDQVDSTAQFLDWFNTPMPQARNFSSQARPMSDADLSAWWPGGDHRYREAIPSSWVSLTRRRIATTPGSSSQSRYFFRRAGYARGRGSMAAPVVRRYVAPVHS